MLLVAEPSLTLDLRAELGTGESLSPLASDLASEEEEERREAEQGGSTWAKKQGIATSCRKKNHVSDDLKHDPY